jgi:hypothetical protein
MKPDIISRMLRASARAAVLTVEFSYAEILERVLAYSIWKRTAATQAGQLPVVRRRRLNADDFVLCLAARAAEDVGRSVWHEPGVLSKGRAAQACCVLPGPPDDDPPLHSGNRRDRCPPLA